MMYNGNADIEPHVGPFQSLYGRQRLSRSISVSTRVNRQYKLRNWGDTGLIYSIIMWQGNLTCTFETMTEHTILSNVRALHGELFVSETKRPIMLTNAFVLMKERSGE